MHNNSCAEFDGPTEISRDVSADTAIRLGRYFGTDPRFWLNLQAARDLSKAEQSHSYKKIVPRTKAA